MSKRPFSAALFLAALLLSCFTAFAQAPAQEQPSRPIDAPKPAPGSASDAAFDAPRRLLQQGRYDEAIAQLEALTTSQPAQKGVPRELGIAYYKKGNYLKAIESFKTALAENSNDGEAIQLMGLSNYLAGRPAEAIPLLEKVQTWFPSANVDAAYILGVCYIQTKDYAQARKAFAKMFGVPPESAAAYLFTARMLLRQDFGPVAEANAQKAVALDPKLPLAHELLGEIYLYQSKIPEAIVELEKELEINPGSAVAYYKLADAYSRVQKFDDAERLLQRSLWLDAASTGPYILLGKVLAKKGETQLAVRALQRAIAMDPNNPIAHHLLGQAYRDLGKSADAEHELQLASQLEQKQNAKP